MIPVHEFAISIDIINFIICIILIYIMIQLFKQMRYTKENLRKEIIEHEELVEVEDE